jgi:hypothetical protein
MSTRNVPFIFFSANVARATHPIIAHPNSSHELPFPAIRVGKTESGPKRCTWETKGYVNLTSYPVRHFDHELRRKSRSEVGCPTHRQRSSMVSAEMTC